MKIFALHSDRIWYRVRDRAVASAPEPEEREAEYEEVLVLFTAFESFDDQSSVDSAVSEVKTLASRLGVSELVLYPWVHLTEEPAPFQKALDLYTSLLKSLADTGFTVHPVPIGWYKEFEIKVKGHPLAESLRTIRPEGEGEASVEEEAEEVSRFVILFPDGSEREVDGWEWIEDPELRIVVRNEVFGKPPSGREPEHIRLMRRLELVDYEPSSDVGHFRFYPEGTLVKRLIEDLAFEVAHRIGAMEIETPLLYRLDDPAIAGQAAKFRERNYQIPMGKTTLILRFAGDFGLFSMMRDMNISYRDLPLSFYEISPSFRLEQRGECVGLRRLRAFTMPDIHSFVADVDQGMEMYERYFTEYHRLLRDLNVDYAVVFRIVESFYERLKPAIVRMLSAVGKPALIELLPKMKHYWALKHEFQVVDTSEGNGQLSTVQLDVEDSERYGIFYVDRDGNKRPGVIVHTSMGSVERLMYAILETAAKSTARGEKPSLPVWLAPTQVRVIPISMDNVEFALSLADRLNSSGIRADVDDRELTLAKRIREAERRWIPYVVVVGKREQETGRLSIRRRRDGAEYEAGVEELISEIKSLTEGKPFRPLNVPMRLSRRPVFVGSS